MKREPDPAEGGHNNRGASLGAAARGRGDASDAPPPHDNPHSGGEHEHPKARFFFPEPEPGARGGGGGGSGSDGPAAMSDEAADADAAGAAAAGGDDRDDDPSLGVGASAARLLLDRLDLLEHEHAGGPRGRRRWLLGLTASLLAATLCGIAAIYLLATPRPPRGPPPTPYQEACSVFCMGRLLEAVQSARLSHDSKTFVDMPMVMDPAETRAAFAVAFGDGSSAGAGSSPPPSKEQLAAFVSQYFYTAGSDTVPHVPSDFQPAPPQLAALGNDTLRAFAFGVHDLWLQLGRRIIPSVHDYQQRFSLLWQPHPLIVPGGRFVESYYWDTYWCILGLLRSGMASTASGMLLNLVYLADTFGFVPNGGRVYYVLPGRSQPPLLSSMVRTLYAATGNASLVAHSYGALRREYSWWMGAGEYGHAVTIEEAEQGWDGSGGADDGGGRNATQPRRRQGHTHILNRFVTDQHIPRPESWLEDTHTAAAAGFHKDDPGAQILYSEIAAAAESGHDFTGRYFADGQNIATCDTSHVIPVDLNAFMYRLERDLAFLANELAAIAANCSEAGSDQVAAEAAEEDEGGGGGGAHHGTIIVGPDGAFVQSHGAGEATLPGDVSREAHAQPRRHHHHRHPAGTGAGASYSDPLCAALLQQYANASVAASAPEALPLLFDGLVGSFLSDAARYGAAAEDRAVAMERLLWDEAAGVWSDLHISPQALAHTEPTGVPQPEELESTTLNRCGVPVGRAVASRYKPRTDLQLGRNVARGAIHALSSYLPLWAGAHCPGCGDEAAAARVRRVAGTLCASGLLQPGGLAATTARTHEQWDHPNGWSPLVWMMAVALEGVGASAGVPEAAELGLEVARRWLLSGLAGYNATGFMYEKMDVSAIGKGGGGGEYVPQTGFGWSNGVALDLLVRYPWPHLEHDAVEAVMTTMRAAAGGNATGGDGVHGGGPRRCAAARASPGS